MKQYVREGQLTLVGKGWEIRRQLQLLSKAALKPQLAPKRPAPLLGEFIGMNQAR